MIMERNQSNDIKKISFIGLGLIGGSIARTIRRIHPHIRLYAVCSHLSTITQAYQAGVIENDVMPDLEQISDSDYIFLCTPVQQNLSYLMQLKDHLAAHTIITDAGSVKGDIHRAAMQSGLSILSAVILWPDQKKQGLRPPRRIFWKMRTMSLRRRPKRRRNRCNVCVIL